MWHTGTLANATDGEFMEQLPYTQILQQPECGNGKQSLSVGTGQKVV